MVWPYIPGCNIHRGAEGDNSVECFGVTRKPHKLQKRDTFGPKWSAVVLHTPSKPPHPPTAAMDASRPTWNLARNSVSAERGFDHCVRKKGVESGNTPRLNTKYCPELGVMYELAKGKLPSKRLKFNLPDLFPEERKLPNPATTSFQEPARLVSSESLVRWNVPSIPWRYLVQENAKPITIKAITKDTQTALTCVAADLDRSTDGSSESSRVPIPNAIKAKHGREDVKSKDHVVDRECLEKQSKGVQTPRHKGVQTENQVGTEGSLDAKKSYCSTKKGSSRNGPVSKSAQTGSSQIGEFKSTKTSETSSYPTKTPSTNPILTPIERRVDLNNRTCNDRPIKARKGKKRIWKRNRRSPTTETLISNLTKTEVAPAFPQSKEVIECVAPNEEKTQANAEHADEVEARKLHVQPTLPMPIPMKCITPSSNIPLAKHEPVPNVVAEDVQGEEMGQKSDADLHAVEDLNTKLEKEQRSIPDVRANTAADHQNSYDRTGWIQLGNTAGTERADETEKTILQQDESDSYLLRITPKKKTTDNSAQTKKACNVSSSRQRKKRDKTTRVIQEATQPIESVSIASSSESLEALERLIEMQHAELVSKGVLPADKHLPLDQTLHTESKDCLRLLLDDGTVSENSTTSLLNEEENKTKEETLNLPNNQSNVASEESVQLQDRDEPLSGDKKQEQSEDVNPEESFQDSYLSQLMHSLSLTQSDDEGVEKLSIESSLIQNSATSDVSESSQNPNNSSSETVDSAAAAAIVALTDYQSCMSSDRRIYDVEVFRQ